MARLSSIKCLSGIDSQKTHELLVIGMFEGGSISVSGLKDLSSSINDKRGDKKYDEVKEDLYTFCKKLLPDNDVYIIVKYNWGGTIAALWYVHNLLKGKEGYIAHFEEDFGPNNIN